MGIPLVHQAGGQDEQFFPIISGLGFVAGIYFGALHH
jgi:hypothetical protein